MFVLTLGCEHLSSTLNLSCKRKCDDTKVVARASFLLDVLSRSRNAARCFRDPAPKKQERSADSNTLGLVFFSAGHSPDDDDLVLGILDHLCVGRAPDRKQMPETVLSQALTASNLNISSLSLPLKAEYFPPAQKQETKEELISHVHSLNTSFFASFSYIIRPPCCCSLFHINPVNVALPRGRSRSLTAAAIPELGPHIS